MTVSELKAFLAQAPEDAEIYIAEHTDAYDEGSVIDAVVIEQNADDYGSVTLLFVARDKA